jgi:hypothetical protein
MERRLAMRRVLVLALVVGTAAVLLPSASAGRDTILVPGPGDLTIQEGLDLAFAAGPGSIVQVAPGTYSSATGEVFPIVMRSGVILRSESGATLTVIDANEEERVMTMSSLAPGTEVEGFTLREGENLGLGGGVHCEDSSVLLEQCVFIDNTSIWDSGGGIYVGGSSSVVMTECHFESNWAFSDLGSEGGAIRCIGSTIDLTDCTFYDNFGYVSGGAISVSGPSAELDGCVFWGNRGHLGGAIRTYADVFTATGCTFYENQATTYDMGGGTGGALYLSSGLVSIVSCTFADNWASPDPFRGGHGGAIYCYVNATLTLTNTIIAFSTNGEAVYGAVPTMSCCDIFGNADGPGSAGGLIGSDGNIAEDPLFCRESAPDTPYALHLDSPCTEANYPACGLIGAWSVGCGGNPVEQSSWGQIKALYR